MNTQRKTCKKCFDIFGNVENVNYFHWGLKAKDVWDGGPGVGDSGVGGSAISFNNVVYGSRHVRYSL